MCDVVVFLIVFIGPCEREYGIEGVGILEGASQRVDGSEGGWFASFGMCKYKNRDHEVLRPAAESVEDISHVGLVARADEVSDVVDDDDGCALGDEVLLNVVEDAATVERCCGIVGV